MIKHHYEYLIHWCISPTLFVSSSYKKRAPTPRERGKRVRTLNITYFTVACILFTSIIILYMTHTITHINTFLIGFYILWSLSRVNEIFMAFMKDVFDKLDPRKRKKNGLQYYERIALALRSFIELILHYAMLYYLLDTCFVRYGLWNGLFNQPLRDPLTALYFSLITIVSIGYGDYYPIHPISKLLVMYEIINGLLLLAVSFTVYVGLDLDEKEAS